MQRAKIAALLTFFASHHTDRVDMSDVRCSPTHGGSCLEQISIVLVPINVELVQLLISSENENELVVTAGPAFPAERCERHIIPTGQRRPASTASPPATGIGPSFVSDTSQPSGDRNYLEPKTDLTKISSPFIVKETMNNTSCRNSKQNFTLETGFRRSGRRPTFVVPHKSPRGARHRDLQLDVGF
jgi:hypothetical protein